MIVDRYFSPAEKGHIKKAFSLAEEFGERYYKGRPKAEDLPRYDVKTLAYLEAHEVKQGTFAHLCKYAKGRDNSDKDYSKENHFYRICL